eukprot:g850.t1
MNISNANARDLSFLGLDDLSIMFEADSNSMTTLFEDVDALRHLSPSPVDNSNQVVVDGMRDALLHGLPNIDGDISEGPHQEQNDIRSAPNVRFEPNPHRSGDALHTRGYDVLEGRIDLETCEKWKKRINRMHAHKFRAIFNNDGEYDGLRSQASIRKSSAMFRTLSDIVDKYNPNLTLEDVVALKSAANCSEQKRHADYDEKAIRDVPDNEVPLGMIVAIMNETKLKIWPNSHRDWKPHVSTYVTLNAGDILLFRGDLIHAGCRYKNENVRIHGYLDSERVDRIKEMKASGDETTDIEAINTLKTKAAAAIRVNDPQGAMRAITKAMKMGCGRDDDGLKKLHLCAQGMMSTQRNDDRVSLTKNNRSNEYRDVIEDLYRRYNPSKLDSIEVLLTKYVGKEEKLIAALRKKYCKETRKDRNTRSGDVSKEETVSKGRKSDRSALPKGFFDDAKADAEARDIDVNADEWDEFQSFASSVMRSDEEHAKASELRSQRERERFDLEQRQLQSRMESLKQLRRRKPNDENHAVDTSKTLASVIDADDGSRPDDFVALLRERKRRKRMRKTAIAEAEYKPLDPTDWRSKSGASEKAK